MNTENKQETRHFHNGFHRSSHYFRSSQPEVGTSENTPAKVEANKPSKEKIIDVFEFEPVGFMSHGRW